MVDNNLDYNFVWDIDMDRAKTSAASLRYCICTQISRILLLYHRHSIVLSSECHHELLESFRTHPHGRFWCLLFVQNPITMVMCLSQVVSELPQIVFSTQVFGILQTWGTGILATTIGKILLLFNATSALFLFEGWLCREGQRVRGVFRFSPAQ